MLKIIFTTETCIVVLQVCPICAANLGKDATTHFTTQHAHLVEVSIAPDNIILTIIYSNMCKDYFFCLQRRRKSQKSDSWSNNSMVPNKNMREMNSYNCIQPMMNAKDNMQENVPDPLLSPFLCNIPLPGTETKVEVNANISCNSNSATSESTRYYLFCLMMQFSFALLCSQLVYSIIGHSEPKSPCLLILKVAKKITGCGFRAEPKLR